MLAWKKLIGVVGLAQLCAVTAAAADGGAASRAAGDVLVRVRAIDVIPEERSTITPIGGEVDATNTWVPEIDFSYFLTDNIAVELIAAVTKHHGSAVATAAGDVPLGSVWLLPPTLTAQYHMQPAEKVDLYVGAGVNYTHMFSVGLPSTGPVTAINYGDSFGPAVQAGVDYGLNDRWFVNLDVKKVWIKSDVEINGGAIDANVHLDPWIIGAGIGYRF